ncbi:tRNA 2-selenouridine(34) synthase MnmH [Congregibacter litoralis]|uniref:tRNA 2-selenouridine synthase n=1 Tax=Congregibacter litoralis KT71 TaxID=314285 RepID=A4A8V4_9GAMM|nr:tRNA 2-selenouridine(34) synthase MnmH [Congregibacter litoralis]EAQ97496.1 tRNA 2-selenouridine synthase [Congregibacter litoralis KT71]
MTARVDTSDYARLFLADSPLLDTRAPVEFAAGAFPMAQSLPLMSDEERAAVGTCYKQQGQEAAIALGHQLVAGEVREERMRRWKQFAEDHPEGYLYCFRGGLRSQLVQEWLKEAGVDYPRISGGYKAMRRFLIDSLDALSKEVEIILVGGATGTGKTRLIQELTRAIDLEGLANHRGSAFGRLIDEQPTQINFENALSIALLKLSQSEGPVILEDEGQLIGRLSLPASLKARMSQAPLVVLEYGLEDRVQVVLEDYILDLGARYQRAYGDAGAAMHRDRLLGDLERTRKRLGGARYQDIAALMRAAFERQEQSGDAESHRDWIRPMLKDYYDPMYRYQLSKREGQRLCSGDRAFVREFLNARC